jgi:hypothetical protein
MIPLYPGDVPDDPARTAGPGELARDWPYRESTLELDADAINDEIWLNEHRDTK